VLSYYDRAIEETTIAMQGYGSVAANAARLLNNWGGTVVAVSDVNGGIYDPASLDTYSIPSHDEKPEAVTQQDAPQLLTSEEILELDVDVLVPAAVGNVLSEDNAAEVRADIIIEGANGPTTSGAGDPRHSRYSCERRRRNRLLFRVATGYQSAVLVAQASEQ
jgi:glutamate dehydrogenase (NAD(P)+)